MTAQRLATPSETNLNIEVGKNPFNTISSLCDDSQRERTLYRLRHGHGYVVMVVARCSVAVRRIPGRFTHIEACGDLAVVVLHILRHARTIGSKALPDVAN